MRGQLTFLSLLERGAVPVIGVSSASAGAPHVGDSILGTPASGERELSAVHCSQGGRESFQEELLPRDSTVT